MKIQTISIVMAASILLAGCGKTSISSGTAAPPVGQADALVLISTTNISGVFPDKSQSVCAVIKSDQSDRYYLLLRNIKTSHNIGDVLTNVPGHILSYEKVSVMFPKQEQ